MTTEVKETPDQGALDHATAQRLAAVLGGKRVRGGVKKRILKELNLLVEWTNPTLPDDPSEPHWHAVMFERCAANYREMDEGAFGKAEATQHYDAILNYIEREEPEEYWVARRIIEIYNAQDEREGKDGNGCYFFMENYVDPVMNGSSDGLVVASPNDELFTLLFTRAAREWEGGKTPNAYTELCDIVRRAGAEPDLDFNALYEEDEQQHKTLAEERLREELAEPEPKDKTSDKWRIWKIRQIEHAIGQGGAVAGVARDEFKDLIREVVTYLFDDPTRLDGQHYLLTHSLLIWQERERKNPTGSGRKAKRGK